MRDPVQIFWAAAWNINLGLTHIKKEGSLKNESNFSFLITHSDFYFYAFFLLSFPDWVIVSSNNNKNNNNKKGL